jgi:hypothetical protein
MADIIDFTGGRVANDDADPDATLALLQGRLSAFVLYGYDLDGNECTVVTFAHLPEALWATKRGEKQLLERVEREE